MSDAARSWLAEGGYDPLFGARPLARLIQEKIKKPLADELLFGQLTKGGLVCVDMADGKPVFTYPGEGADKGASKKNGKPKKSSKKTSKAVKRKKSQPELT